MTAILGKHLSAMTKDQQYRLAVESRGGVLCASIAGDVAIGVVLRGGEPMHKVRVLPDGSVECRFDWLPKEDRWGAPWMIQDPQPGDGAGVAPGTVSEARPTVAQEAVLSRSERETSYILDGAGMSGDDLIVLIPGERGSMTERRVTRGGSWHDVAHESHPQTMSA